MRSHALRRTSALAALLATATLTTAVPATARPTAPDTAAPLPAPNPAAPGLGDDVVAWMASVNPNVVVDEACTSTGDAIAYLGDSILVRSASKASAIAAVDRLLRVSLGPPPGSSWVDTARTKLVTLPVPPSGPAITPVVAVQLVHRPGGEPHEIVHLARALRDDSETPGDASPNYVMAPSPFVFFWPNGNPTAAASLAPQRTLLTPATSPVGPGLPVGTGVRVAVYDTGFVGAVVPRLANVAALLAGDREEPDRVKDGEVDYPHAGHGRAIAGIIATLAPGARIEIGRVSDRLGLATDVSILERIVASLKAVPRAQWPDLVGNAFGSPACDRADGQPPSNVNALEPLGLRAVTETVDRFAPVQPDGMLLVTSAGNRGTSRPFYPGGFNRDPDLRAVVVAIGSIDANLATDGDASEWFTSTRTGPVSTFSNRGTWVDGYAPGEHLATTHLSGLAWEKEDGSLDTPLSGKAYVDGTSFSMPYVLGLIAERMSTNGGTALAAWNAIKATGRAPLPPCDGNTTSIGNGVAVGLPSLASSATAAASGTPPTC